MLKDNYCWICHFECYHKLHCNKCGRNFHLTCVSSEKPRFACESNGLKKFETFCPECISADNDANKWTKGQDFEPISRKKLNHLFLYILDLIKEDAPKPFLWPSNTFRVCANPIDVQQIQQRAKNNHYDCPKAFLRDVHLINHNCMVLFRYPGKLRIDKSLIVQLVDYDKVIETFRRNIEAKVRYLEDCPHCICNFVRSPENWLTMACPWGHPLILTEVDGIRLPAKMINFNRLSGRIDIILFRTGERTRVCADKCWIPGSSDLANDKRDSPEISLAKCQARKYTETMEKKFKIKIVHDKEKQKLSTSDKDYIQKFSQPDVVELTDDEAVIPVNDVEPDKSKVKTNGESSNQINGEVNDGSNGSVITSDNSNSNIDTVEDEVIDEISELDEPNFEDTADTVMPSQDPLLLTTLIERIPSPVPSDQTESAMESTQVPETNSEPITTPTSATNEPSVLAPNEPSISKSITISTAIFTSTSTSTPPPTPPTPSTNNAQFAIVSDEDDDTQTNEIDSEPIEDKTITNLNEKLLSPLFVVEDDQDSNGVAQFQPISPCRLSLNQEDSKDTIFEIAPNGLTFNQKSSSELVFPVKINGFTDFHQSKKIKLDQDIANTSHSFEIKRLEQQLEFADKEKQLNLQQIAEVQEQLRLTKQMEETKLKTIEIQFQSQIKSLEDTLEKEKKMKEDLNTKLVKVIEEGVSLVYKVEQTKLFWQNKLTEEHKAINEQHKQEMDIKTEEIVSLKAKLEEIEKKYKTLENEHNIIVPKYKRLSRTLQALTQDFADDQPTLNVNTGN